MRLPDRRWVWITAFAALGLLLYGGLDVYHIARQANRDETQAADVIVVFGAAEYAGKPSPIFRARLEHGRQLYLRGLAPRMIVTGGGGGEVEYTEGTVGRDYLIAAGVSEAALIAETMSEDTSDSATRIATIMRANEMKSCIAVSDGYHLYRIKRMLAEHGVRAYGSPRPGKRLTRSQRATLYLREALSLTLWRLNLK